MVEIQPAPEGPVDPAMVPSPSPKDADRERRRRRRVLWGAVGVVVVLALLLGVGGLAVVVSFGCGRRFAVDHQRASAAHEHLPSVRC
mgnify:CR=1 FL=1